MEAQIAGAETQIDTYTTDEIPPGDAALGNSVRSSLGKQLYWLCKRSVRVFLILFYFFPQ
jgi:hypothetical protein